MHSKANLIAIPAAFAALTVSALFVTKNQEPTVPEVNVSATRDCSSEKLRDVIDEFRQTPTDEKRAAVQKELAALDDYILTLEDRAELANGGVKAQLLLDAEALRIARRFNFERFIAPIEEKPVLAATKAEPVVEAAAAAEPEVRKAVAVDPSVQLATLGENVPVRRAVAVAAAIPAAEALDQVPVRRAIPVTFSSERASVASNSMIVIRSDSGRRLTIWKPLQQTDFTSHFARR